MKRIMALMLSALMIVGVLAGCSQNDGTEVVSAPESSSSESVESETESEPSDIPSEPEEKSVIKIAALKGPTGLGMVKLMEDAENGEAANEYEFTLVGDANEVVGKISTGEIDVAAVPTNLAATLYGKTEGGVQLAALNTLGVLYLLSSSDDINTVEDLRGKTIYATGQGSVPEYALNYILSSNGLEPGKDVTVEYKTEHSELATLAISGEAPLCMLPEPFVTQVTAKNPDLHVVLDLTEEWDRVVDGKSVLTMGGLIVRKEFAENNKEAFDKFLEEYEDSVAYTNTQLEDAAELSEKFDIMPADVAQKAIPNCNIVFLSGDEMKAKVGDFFDVLFQANPKSVGGEIPGDDFYYQK